MELELPAEVHEQIVALSASGDALAGACDWTGAISKYNDAWKIIPEPKNEWEASTWLLAAIADACFFAGYFESALDALRYALQCPGGAANPFLHLRLGQCAFEKNSMNEATEHLARAYMLEGAEIFHTDNSKYFEFLKTKISPPASGQW
ncbi:tetratricopeptide repeat protein [Janthinobacterium lividum]|uniref:tetratricopeptide repeat protein n=1 Tax=Janthinobacterium lividum TaxID=29581 RepID=UPI0015952844|nr:tetratricopeptide repeat protein [Janthinobacterium lividum]QKY09151.1 tetratricopeptide repeat protein [Janthinobacterium lividum]